MLKKYNTVFFDLDGTIIDSSPGITKSASYAMRKILGMNVKPASLNCFIGPPLKEQFMKYCGVDEETGIRLVAAYREYYSVDGLFECSIYPGIPELLGRLRESGYSILLATLKPEVFAKRILDHFDLTRYFDYIAGAGLDNFRTVKYEVITYALEHVSEQCRQNHRLCVMIGDSPHDVTGANKAGMDGIAVLYGFGNRQLLAEVPAVARCSCPEQIFEYINGKEQK